MIKKSTLVAAAALFVAQAAQAAVPVADFELNGSLANSAGTAATLVNNGGTLGAAGITFGANQGPTITGLPSQSVYTIDTVFIFDTLSGYRKIADFSGLLSDAGLYTFGSSLNFFPLANSGTVDFTAGNTARLTFSRSASGALTGYVNGTLVLNANDSAGLATISSLLGVNFFQDDAATGKGEASSGFVDYIRLYDSVITPAEALAAPDSAVPEPATWALMLFGFGGIGMAMRRSRRGNNAIRTQFA